ncbi:MULTISPECIES: hypothetical protein [Rahnella]|jgi:hypothetical protein|uniref:Uncharacterized protein n=1 Tax=Rahnella contaminans TaxID=2703882 RepID=A0A6M2B6P0_9GAMM|nr:MULTISPECIES: hypothetical protein [Rahnella]KAB8308574.1 hypothetical protein EH227_11505 [Rouxiella chamberiensis]MBU9819256.1 hypothetical protein [Rahnella sp. BCC 1045]MCS3421868.1 hypothetical protein [Rahnella sp. BIGb0603]MDF1893453.1 hypothetical protein [Rahnella contaminans]NGX88312.1 hypothetical protein [Rahnella contaminans]
MTMNTTKNRKSFTARLTHIMQIQTQYGRLWLRSRFRRFTLPPALKLIILTLAGFMILAITGTLLLMMDLISLMLRLIKRPFPRGSLHQVRLPAKAV